MKDSAVRYGVVALTIAGMLCACDSQESSRHSSNSHKHRSSSSYPSVELRAGQADNRLDFMVGQKVVSDDMPAGPRPTIQLPENAVISFR